MLVKVMNRQTISEYKEVLPHIVISIHDPSDSPAPLAENSARRAVLNLAFHDWDDKQKITIENMENKNSYVFFSEKQAREVFHFVQTWAAHVEIIICQCDAGISRSAGMAAALSRILNGMDEYFFKHYVPNSRVYRLMLNAWIDELEKL